MLAFAAAVSGAAVATLQYLTNGAFLVNVVGYNVNHFSISRLMFLQWITSEQLEAAWPPRS